MTKKSKKRGTYKSLENLWMAGATFTLFSTSVFQSFGKYADLIRQDKILFIQSSILALFTFALFVAYWIATHYELNLLSEYFDEDDMPRIMPKTYIVVVGLAILCGALIAVSHKILIYSIIIVSYNLFDLWGGWQVAKTLAPGLEKRLATDLNKDEREDLETIKSYYFSNPTLPRVVTLMFVNWVVVCLSLSYYYTNLMILRNIAYILIMVNIASGEVVIHYWRMKSIYKLK